MDRYEDFAALAAAARRGRDYWVAWRRRSSPVLVVAPHGGWIEPGTDRVARAIAGRDFSWYVFLGLHYPRRRELHLTSTSFDEPRALALVAAHRWVLAVHGCGDPGEAVLLGGLDQELKEELAAALAAAGLEARLTGHAYPGRDPCNICNRGRTGAGVQLELTRQLRNGPRLGALVAAVRQVLLRRTGQVPRRVWWERLFRR